MGSVTVQVPDVQCIRCNKTQTPQVTKVQGNQAADWDPPTNWYAARFEVHEDRVVYVCGDCLPSAPFYLPGVER